MLSAPPLQIQVVTARVLRRRKTVCVRDCLCPLALLLNVYRQELSRLVYAMVSVCRVARCFPRGMFRISTTTVDVPVGDGAPGTPGRAPNPTLASNHAVDDVDLFSTGLLLSDFESEVDRMERESIDLGSDYARELGFRAS